MEREREELWFVKDDATGNSAELERIAYSDGSRNYLLHTFDERPSRVEVFMYLDRKQLKDLRAAIDYVLDEKDKRGNNEDSDKSLFPNA